MLITIGAIELNIILEKMFFVERADHYFFDIILYYLCKRGCHNDKV